MATELSLIISTYNWPEALDRVLSSVVDQQSPPVQVIIADDGSDERTQAVIERWRSTLTMPLLHAWRPDDGFRAGEARNRAAALATGRLLVFVDGDCLLRPQTLAAHQRLAEDGWTVAGNRILLSQSLTNATLAGSVNPLTWGPLDWLRARLAKQVNRLLPVLTLPGQAWRRRRRDDWLLFRTCNVGVWRQDFERVNGFDERLNGWGFEDSDLAIRLNNAGIGIKSGRFATGVLHLWHRENARDQAERNRQHALQMLRDGTVRAGLGLAERAQAASAADSSPISQ